MKGESMVDLIVVYHNRPDLAAKCIKSIKRSTKVPYNLIVIDNACKTRNADLRRFDEDGVCFIHNKENIGYEKAVNQGLKLSKSPYVCFMNDDIMVTENWLSRMLAHFERNSRLGALGPCSNFVMWKQRTILSNDTGKLPFRKIDKAAKENYEKHEGQLVGTSLLVGFCFMVRRAVINEIGGLDEQFGFGGSDDLDYSIRIRQAGWILGIAKDVFVYHWGNKTLGKMNEHPDFDFDRLLEEGQELLRKKWGIGVFEEMLFHEGNNLGLALIVKDEEKTLPRCLSNISKIADQIVIVDTGSTDKTKEVARQFTDDIYNFEWIDDFSAARNYSLSKLNTGWGLWLDADDYVGREECSTIRFLTQNPGPHTAFAFQTHCLNDFGDTELINTRIRLIRMDRSYVFERRIHEFLNLRGDEAKVEHLGIIHGGPALAGTKNKEYQIQFNLKILRKEIVERPGDLFVLFNLARALKGAGEIKEAHNAYHCILKATSKEKNDFCYMASMGLAEIEIEAKNYGKARDYAYNAVQCSNLRAEPYNTIGLSYYYEGIFHKAAAAFETALIKKPQIDTFIPIDLGAYNYKSFVNLGSCQFQMAQFDGAIDSYEKALGFNPRCEDARRNLAVTKNKRIELLQSQKGK